MLSKKIVHMHSVETFPRQDLFHLAQDNQCGNNSTAREFKEIHIILVHYWEGNKGNIQLEVVVLARSNGGTIQNLRAEYFPMLPDQG